MSGMSTQVKQAIWENDLLTVKEVAAYLRVSRVTVWRWCQQGIIPASRVGRSWRIPRSDLLNLLKTSPSLQVDPLYPQSTAGDNHRTQTSPTMASEERNHPKDGYQQ